jgi:hypothetical protein
MALDKNRHTSDAQDFLQGARNERQHVFAVRPSNRNPGIFFGFGTCAGRASPQTGYTSLFFMAEKVAGKCG